MNSSKVSSNITAPLPGSDGDQSAANTCARAGCHNSSTVQTPGPGDLSYTIGIGTPTIDLNGGFKYMPGDTYSLSFLLNQTATRYGFQTSVTDATLHQAGTWTLTNTANTSTSTAFSRTYVGHKNASTTKNWFFNWTAPATGTGPVTFYYAYNLANGDGTPLNDLIYKGSITILEQTSGIEDISNKISSLNIFPTPVSSEFNISFDLKEVNDVSSVLYSLDGKVCKELLNRKLNEGNFNQSFDLHDIPAGIYLVKLNVGEASATKKIMKL